MLQSPEETGARQVSQQYLTVSMTHNNVFLTHLNSHVSQQSAFNASFFCLISKVKYFPMTSCDPSLKRRFESYVTDGTKTHFCEFEFAHLELPCLTRS